MRKYTLLILIGSAFLAGCASEPVDHCKLNQHTKGCYSMEQVYHAAAQSPSNTSAIQQIMRKHHEAPTPPPRLPNPVGYNTGYADPGTVGEPVFKQPKVYRVWIAPYVDADGNLRSGEYTYFSTPGQWAYGSLRTPGSASAGTLFAPSRATALGFKPDLKNTNGAPPIPPGQVQNPVPVNPNGITPPAEKLTGNN